MENRLREAVDLSGSPEYALRWKSVDMILGPPISRLRASRHRISASESFGWPTPNASDSKRGGDLERTGGKSRVLNNYALLAGSPKTETHNRAGNTGSSRKTEQLGLEATAKMAGWATPSARDWKDSPGMKTTGVNPDGSLRKRLDQLPRQAVLAGWASPRASDSKKNYRSAEAALREIARKGISNDLGLIVSQFSAPMEPTEQSLVLNPEFSRWLMGYPEAWTASAPGSDEWLRWQIFLDLTTNRSDELDGSA